MKRLLLIFVLIVSLAGCTEPTPTTSPLVTPTSQPSPIETPEKPVEQSAKPQSETGENTMSLFEVLAAVAAGGAVLGGIISFLFERFKWFQALTADAKFWTVGALSIGLPLIATALVQNVPADVWVTLEPYWQGIFAGGVVWLGTQLFHKRANKASS